MRPLLLALALAGTLSLGTFAPAVPAAHAQSLSPALTLPVSAHVGHTVTVTGQNFAASNWVYVYYQRPDGTANAVYVQTDSQGRFSFNLGFTTAHGTGIEYLRAYDFGTARWSPGASIVVTAGTPVPVRQLEVSASSVAPGNTISVSGQGFGPSNWVYVYFQRPNGTSGAYWTVTGPNGGFWSTLGFNAANGCGAETIWAYDYGTGQWSTPATVTVTGCSALAAPSNPQIVTVIKQQTVPQQTTVTLRWQDNSTVETGFRIRATFARLYGGTDGQQWDMAANTTMGSVTFISGGLNPVKIACFTVSALSGNAESAPSNQVCVQP